MKSKEWNYSLTKTSKMWIHSPVFSPENWSMQSHHEAHGTGCYTICLVPLGLEQIPLNFLGNGSPIPRQAQLFTNPQGSILKCPSPQIWAHPHLTQLRTQHRHFSDSALSLETGICWPALALPSVWHGWSHLWLGSRAKRPLPTQDALRQAWAKHIFEMKPLGWINLSMA